MSDIRAAELCIKEHRKLIETIAGDVKSLTDALEKHGKEIPLEAQQINEQHKREPECVTETLLVAEMQQL